MAGVKGILFDLGDTLLDFGAVDTIDLFEQGARLTYEYLRGMGQPLPSFSKYHRRQLWAIRWAYFKSRIRRREFNSLDVLGGLSLRMGQRLDQRQMDELAWLWYKPLSLLAKVEAELSGILQGLMDKGLKLAIVSNTFIPGKVLDRHLEQEGLLRFFPVRVYSCDVRYRKPHKRIFRLALEEMGLTPAEALFVGDSLLADVDGASRAGMVTILKDPAGRKTHRRIRPDHVIRGMSELPAVVAKYA